MRRWRHPTSRDLWVAARPAPGELPGLVQEAIETGHSSNHPPAVKHHRLPPKLLPVRVLYIWPTGVAGGRAVPPDVREEPGGALYVHSP